MMVNTAVWGPMFLLGLFSLSEFVESITAGFIEHVLSNLFIPAYLYGAYAFYEMAVFEETWQGWAGLGLYSLLSYISYRI